MQRKRIVITGLGVVSCLGNDPKQLYRRLLNGESGISPIVEFPCDQFSSRIAGTVRDFDPGDLIDKKQARRIDRYMAFAIWAGKQALLSANIPLSDASIDRKRAGVIVGSGVGGISTFFDNARSFLEKGPRRVSPFLIPHIIPNMGGAMLAQDVGFMGPAYSVSTACATGSYAIILAARHIMNGDADVMICGGVEATVSPIGLAGFCALKALSENNEHPTQASRPWDKRRDGFVMSEGAGIVILENLETAKARGAPILAEYLGGAVNCDAYHMTDPRPDGLGVAMCVTDALKDANIRPEQVSYINAHATSTIPGDRAEIKGLSQVFQKPQSIVMNATKSMIGHALGAAGGIGGIVATMAIDSGQVHPTINLDDPEDVPFDIPLHARSVDIEAAIVNSLGFGGHNSTFIVAPYRE
jgi:3-oxoacyl-[acyl-carrier-protein] synthase II